MDTEELPETYVIFITEEDVLGLDLPLYHIDRVVRESGALFGDQAHIVYASAAYQGEDELGRLMHDFRTSDPADMYYDVLARQVQAVKSDEKGVTAMSTVMDELIREGYDRGVSIGYDQGVSIGYDKGVSIGYDQGVGIGSAMILEHLMKVHRCNLDQAMEMAGLPREKRAMCEDGIRNLHRQPNAVQPNAMQEARQ